MSSDNDKTGHVGRERTRAAFFLLFSGIALVIVIGLILAFSTSVSSVELYHRAWEQTSRQCFDPATLPNWQSWEHKFNHLIKNDADAVKYANEMLAANGDKFTHLHSREEVKALEERFESNYAGVGIAFEAQLDNDNKPVLDKLGKPLLAENADGYPIVQEIFANSPASTGGIKAGDAITAVDGQSTQDMDGESIVKLILGPVGKPVALTYTRNGISTTVQLIRAHVHRPSVVSKLLDNEIGYIRLTDFMARSATVEFVLAMEDLKNAKALIIDLRNNPGGDMTNAIFMASLFIEKGTIVSIKTRIPGDAQNPEYEEITYGVDNKLLYSRQTATDNPSITLSESERLPYLANKRPVVILVNGHSASASEIFTGALNDNDVATVIGTKTFGKGIGQHLVPLANGTILRITAFRYYTPNGTWLGDGCNTECHGIDPDIVVEPEHKFFKPGSSQDNQLKAAETFLLEKLNSK
jgi:carboxyl-terminal processing protease